MKFNNGQQRKFEIGEIYLMNFNGIGNEQQGLRPGLVFQNNVGNKHSPNLIALPLTSSIKKLDQPTHVFIPADETTGLLKDSIVLCENPECISKKRIGVRLTKLPTKYMEQIVVANLLSSSAISLIAPEVLLSTWQKALKLNASAI